MATQDRSPKQRTPAVEGWFTTDGAQPHLLGTRCSECGTFTFPPQRSFCPNPQCTGTDLKEVELSRRGRVWSSTVNRYAPPPPAISPDPFVPYGVAAVELDEERMVVLGRFDGDKPIPLGTEVELVVDTLYEDEDGEYLVWKWRPVAAR